MRRGGHQTYRQKKRQIKPLPIKQYKFYRMVPDGFGVKINRE
jgi:hypothetical protein